MATRISIIAAIAKNDRAIGYQNKLLWNIPSDLRYFKQITFGHPIIMGRLTYESIGRPLSNRLNIILSKNEKINFYGCKTATSIKETLIIAQSTNSREIFFIGGSSVYAQAMQYADRLYLTLVEGNYQADVYFPDYSQFNKVISCKKATDNNYKFEYVVLEKQ